MAKDQSHHQSPRMAESSSFTNFHQPIAPQLMSIKLTENNYILWKSLFIPVLKASNMLNHAEGREQCPPQFLTTDDEDEKESRRENPAYTSWILRDQVFLTWINASLSPNLLRYTSGCTSGRALWVHLEDVLAKSAEAHVLSLKGRLQNLKFSNLNSKDCLKKAREIPDELEAAGSPLSDSEFNSVTASIRNQSHRLAKRRNLLLRALCSLVFILVVYGFVIGYLINWIVKKIKALDY